MLFTSFLQCLSCGPITTIAFITITAPLRFPRCPNEHHPPRAVANNTLQESRFLNSLTGAACKARSQIIYRIIRERGESNEAPFFPTLEAEYTFCIERQYIELYAWCKFFRQPLKYIIHYTELYLTDHARALYKNDIVEKNEPPKSRPKIHRRTKSAATTSFMQMGPEKFIPETSASTSGPLPCGFSPQACEKSG